MTADWMAEMITKNQDHREFGIYILRGFDDTGV